ncbi:MAG: nicotinamide mononucleotide transporter [Rhodothermales bacterium]|nr:nicotinamide mononucleotide transporter [Rhodothermales bacterium]
MDSVLTWENAAVVLAIAYLVLAMRENILCWLAAFLSTAIYTVVFWEVSLFMESALNVFYMVMAVYGWWAWTRGGAKDDGMAIHSWTSRQHAMVILGILALTLLTGWLLTGTGAARPYVDSFTTVASVITTFMVARKVLENWLYWIVIDAVSIWLYLDRGLESTAGLFALYVVLAVVGYYQWRARAEAQPD